MDRRTHDRAGADVMSWPAASRSLGWRLVLSFAAIGGLVAVVFFWVRHDFSRREIVKAHGEEAQAEANFVAGRLEAALKVPGAALTPAAAKEALAGRHHRTVDVVVLGPVGEILAADPPPAGAKAGPEVVEKTAPVTQAGLAGGPPAGSVRVRVDPTGDLERLAAATWLEAL